MNQGNQKFSSSSHFTGAHDVSRHGLSIVRVVKSSRLNNEKLANKTISTRGTKINGVIHTRIRSPKKLPRADTMTDLLSFPLSRTVAYPQTQSSIVGKPNKPQATDNTETIQHHQPGSASSWDTDDFQLNSSVDIVSSARSPIFRSTRVHDNQNINMNSAFEFGNFDTISTQSNERNSRDKSYGLLNDIKTIGKKKKRFCPKLSGKLVCTIALLALLIAALIAGIVVTIVMTSKDTTKKTTVTTTSQTTVTTTSATTTTTTTTTTSVTTTTATTTATTRPVTCPSAVWHPNGTTVAGSSNGNPGSSASLLNGAYDVRVDSALNVYVADYSNYRFMKWPPNSTNGTVIGPKLGAGSSADTQHLNTATTLCFDSTESNLYLSDTFNCRILKLNIASGNITVVIGSGCGNALNQIDWCDGLYIDRFDNIYAADWINDRVLKFPPSSNLSTHGVIVAGTGVAGSALNQLNTPWNIYIDESDNDTLYVSDYANHRVMKWLANATNGTIVAGGNGAGLLYTQLTNPQGVFVDSFGTVFVADYGNHRIMKWLKGANNGTLVAGVSGSAGNTAMKLYGPSGIQFDKNGDLYVSDYGNNRIQRFTINSTSC
ncbi:unnamed protein product [Adineta ricciae]|uniref:Uncharacterized protein n=1 Tax=Adineta ricciae TaxID=249248 RepID=A0A816DXH3_ADIRI|nr:unnamed protein product [Adineta ricciae]CAF1643206.1 unnamed protein product [Adineta ricciae]